MRIGCYFVIIALHWSIATFSQSNQVLRSQATEAVSNKDWYSAAQYYNRLFLRDSSNTKIQYRYAETSRLSYDLDIALRMYKKVVEIDNGSRYPLTFYWIGQLLKNKGNYKEAKTWFAKFNKLNLKKEKYRYFKFKSKLEVDACDLAQLIINSDTLLSKPEHLEVTINSKQSEYGAFEKDSTLYFSSVRMMERKPNELKEPEQFSRIYKSEIRRRKLLKTKVLDTIINANNFHTANTCFSPDNKQMIISRCLAKNASDYVCDLYISNLINKRWQVPVRMDEPVNQPSVSTTQPALAEIGGKTYLFFSSDRPGGEGGMDIWYSIATDSGTYGKPLNAGKQVNTPDDEITPWFVTKENLLYFSSTYHKGLGGFDIYKSEFTNGEFKEPHNAGIPFNSSHNDLYYNINKGGNHIYLSSNRTGSYFEGRQNCCNDIYRITIDTAVPRPKPIVIDSTVLVKEKIKLLVPLTLYFNNDEPDPKTKNTSTLKNYATTYSEYKQLSQQFISEYTKGLKGDPKDIAKNNIENFFTDSLDAGMEALDHFSDLLVKVLENGETVVITMKGYCSPLASSDYNIRLAKRRISSLRNYFTEYKEGKFRKHINNETPGEGKIVFEDVDVGELPVSKTSDDLKDKRNSVYSPQAASERKIQVIAVSFAK